MCKGDKSILTELFTIKANPPAQKFCQEGGYPFKGKEHFAEGEMVIIIKGAFNQRKGKCCSYKLTAFHARRRQLVVGRLKWPPFSQSSGSYGRQLPLQRTTTFVEGDSVLEKNNRELMMMVTEKTKTKTTETGRTSGRLRKSAPLSL